MSLQPCPKYTVPEETARVARAIFPKGNLYMQLYDTFGLLFEDQDFVELFPKDGQPALSPVRLSLILILQFAEGLSDRQAADAVRVRIDWKYLLCLELTDAGFHYSVLSEFRARLVTGKAEKQLFEKLLMHFQEQGLLKGGGQQRTDSTQVLADIRTLNRLETVGETMRHALNTLAVVAPEWVLAHSHPEWVERYRDRVNDYQLPKSKVKRETYAETIGMDGKALLEALLDPAAPSWLREIPAVRTLWLVWIQSYTWDEEENLRWRGAKERPPSHITIHSPYDPEARFSKKRKTSWVGYKVHLTETCDDDHPRLITHVETTPATTHDIKMTTPIHEALQAKDCLPETHLVDSGYLDAELLATSQQDYQVDLVGPTRQDTAWQARQGKGFAAKDFLINWEEQYATCPAGKKSLHWLPAKNYRGKPIISIRFSKSICRECAFTPQCTQSNPPRRSVAIRPEAHHKALLAAREREKTDAFKLLYARRAGVEGTISQGVRRCGMRRTRYVGLAKTHLQHVFTAMAINIIRSMNWLANQTPAQTRQSAFARLHASVTA